MEELKELMERKSKRSKSARRKRKQKEKIRNILRGQNILEDNEAAEEDQELFRLQDIASGTVLKTIEDVADDEDDDDSEVRADIISLCLLCARSTSSSVHKSFGKF